MISSALEGTVLIASKIELFFSLSNEVDVSLLEVSINGEDLVLNANIGMELANNLSQLIGSLVVVLDCTLNNGKVGESVVSS